MKKRLVFILVVIGILLANLVNGISCSNENKEGELPVYNNGDKWVYNSVIDNDNYTFTGKVVDTEIIDDKDCYVFDLSYDPILYEVFGTVKAWTPKSEPYFSGVKATMEGTVMNISTSITIHVSAEYPDGTPWPLEVGKEFTLTEVGETTSVVAGETSTETQTETTTWKVEGKEDVTVSAGEFSCFVIKRYNEDGELLETWWYSDEIKNDVKSIDAITGDTNELKSYSIS